MGLKQTSFFANSSYEPEDTEIIICKECSCHLCLSSLILSDNFVGSSGAAYLVDKLINYTEDDEIVETAMKTGTYLISFVRCHQCHIKFGWVYRKAFKQQETYKERKFVLEEKFISTISNNSSTASIIERIKADRKDLLLRRRRRSSANSASSIDTVEEDNSFQFEKINTTGYYTLGSTNIHNKTPHIPYPASLSFQGQSDASFFHRLRFRAADQNKDDIIDDEAVV